MRLVQPGFKLWLLIAGMAVASRHEPARAEAPPTVKFSKRCLIVNPNEGCAVGDINRDGKLDIVAGTHWYAAPDFAARPIRDLDELMEDFVRNNGDFLFDVNGDGWLDVISGSWLQSEIYWFENPGEVGLERGMKWESHLLAYGRTPNEGFAFHDLDGDGKPELVANCWNKEEPLVAYRLVADPQTGGPSLRRVVLGINGGGHGWAFGDVNGDGREDIMVAAGWYERPAERIFAKPWKLHPETALRRPSGPFLVVDVDQDGRNDVIWGKGHDYGLYWWQQGAPEADGTTTWSEHLIDDSWSQAHCMALADLDGDGQDDLITGKRVRGHSGRDPGGREPACLYYYTWDRATSEFHRHTIAGPGEGIGTGLQIRIADLNEDERPDIVVAGKSGTWLLMNTND